MEHVLRLVMLFFCCAFAFGQNESPAPETSQAPMSESSAIQQATQAAVSNQQEYVRLSEILISTPDPKDAAQVAEAQRKAEEVLQAIRHGGTFSDLAKTNSQGPSAAQGGLLGAFKRGQLAPSLEEVVFGMKVGDVSDLIRTKQGFVILQVNEHNFFGTMKGRKMGPLDILSDTKGVDFGQYLQDIVQKVRRSWYQLIPPSAQTKKGKLAIEFAITKDGHVQDIHLVDSSGDEALERPAYGAIVGSSPFPPLPSEFTGPYLALRFRFYYNPDRNELQ